MGSIAKLSWYIRNTKNKNFQDFMVLHYYWCIECNRRPRDTCYRFHQEQIKEGLVVVDVENKC